MNIKSQEVSYEAPVFTDLADGILNYDIIPSTGEIVLIPPSPYFVEGDSFIFMIVADPQGEFTTIPYLISGVITADNVTNGITISVPKHEFVRFMFRDINSFYELNEIGSDTTQIEMTGTYQNATVTFCSSPNYAGTATIIKESNSGYLANSTDFLIGSAWADIDGAALVWTEIDTSNESFNYNNYMENLLLTYNDDFSKTFSAASKPIKYAVFELNTTNVLYLITANTNGQELVIASTFNYGYPAVNVQTFASSSQKGILSLADGRDTSTVLQYGFKKLDGTVDWQGTAEVNVTSTSWNGAKLSIEVTTDLPDGWSFTQPVRQADGSWLSALNVTGKLNTFKIVGARSTNTTANNFMLGRLVALDSATLEPVQATWTYEDQVSEATSNAFLDIKPSSLLTVSSPGYKTNIVNRSNIFMVDNTWPNDLMSSPAVMVAITDQGKAICSGDLTYGGSTPPDVINHNLVSVCTPGKAICALRSNGSVFAWGSNDAGALVPESILELTDIVAVRGGLGNFYILCSESPYLRSWGTNSSFLTIPDEISSLPNIIDLIVATNYILVLTNSGVVYSFGSPLQSGRVIPNYVSVLTNIYAIYATSYNVSAILYGTGQVAAWGTEEYGGKVPDDIAELDDIERLVCGNSSICALRKNRSVVAWGDIVLPKSVSEATDIIDIQTSGAAYYFLRENGQILLSDLSSPYPADPTWPLATISTIPTVNKLSSLLNVSALQRDGQYYATNSHESNNTKNMCSVSTITNLGGIRLKADGVVDVINFEKPEGLDGNVSYIIS
ncbi:hypothetical protein [Rahnella contaminans]|uniref:hypothetical protein n=1 Tax=Rahnella contaminans TaxID=2703882 RepID=UPI003C3006F0